MRFGSGCRASVVVAVIAFLLLPSAVGAFDAARPRLHPAAAPIGVPAVRHVTSAATAAPHPLTGSTAKWFNLTAGLNPAPKTRYGDEMAYDAKDGYVLMFGGTNGATFPFTDTWTYKTAAWTQLFPATAPPDRIGAVMVYDPVDQCVVMFGGVRVNGTPILGDTWEFAGGVWTNVTTGTGPAPRVDASAEWDPDIQSIVLFGGQNSTQSFGDTWRFVGGTWTELFPASSPSARVAPGLTYDAADGYLLLFGGATATANLADTYRFSNNTWTEIFPSSAPTGRVPWQTVYDASLGAVLLFGGGVGNDSLFFGDTWTFHAGQWAEQFPTSSPAARQFNGMAWDPVDDYAITFAGESQTSNHTGFVQDDTWVYVAAPVATVAPVAGAHDTSQTVGLSVSVSGGVPPYAVAWTFGDGGSATGLATGHSYGSAGTFPIVANVTDAFEESGIGTASVTIYGRPTVAVSANLSAPTTGENLTLTGTVTGGAPPITSTWSVGDRRTFSGPGPLHLTYSVTGPITVNLTVTDGAGVTASGVVSFVVSTPAAAKSSGPTVPWLLVGIGVVVVIVAAVAVFALSRRRRPPVPPAGASPPAGWAPPPTSPPPPS